MKIVKTANGKKDKIKMSKKEWSDLGKKAGWIKEAFGGGEDSDYRETRILLSSVLGKIKDLDGSVQDFLEALEEHFESDMEAPEVPNARIKISSLIDETLNILHSYFPHAEDNLIDLELMEYHGDKLKKVLEGITDKKNVEGLKARYVYNSKIHNLAEYIRVYYQRFTKPVQLLLKIAYNEEMADFEEESFANEEARRADEKNSI